VETFFFIIFVKNVRNHRELIGRDSSPSTANATVVQ